MKTKWTTDSLLEFELKVKKEFEDGHINCPIHLSGGNEEALISIFELVNPQDYVISTHRNHYHYLLKGGDSDILMKEIRGEKGGCCGGVGRSMHIYDTKLNFYTTAVVAGGCAIAVGIGLGIKKLHPDTSKKRPYVWCFQGDGAEDSGHFMEAVRFSLARGLPVTFVIEDNDYAVESTKKDRWMNFAPMQANNIIRYTYSRIFPHVGIGKHVSM
jgi:pyruvate dehydrogenase E1 component alpha subunit